MPMGGAAKGNLHGALPWMGLIDMSEFDTPDCEDTLDNGSDDTVCAADMLRTAREQAGKTLTEVAHETRVPLRHLSALETGNLSAFPSMVYAYGFARSFAASVGADADHVVALMRDEHARDANDGTGGVSAFEPGDPDRIPARRLGWISLFAAILLFAGLAMFFSRHFFASPGVDTLVNASSEPIAPISPTQKALPTKAKAPAQDTGANANVVTLTATEGDIWIRIFDKGSGERVLEKVLAKGEQYTVPANIAQPRINTGRPDALVFTVGGQEVARLADKPMTISEGDLSASALRGAGDNVAKTKAATAEAW